MWISLLVRFWYIPAIILILGYSWLSHVKLTICQTKVASYQIEINNLIKESKVAQGRAEAANKEAKEELKEHEKEAEAILGEKMPKDCMGAMGWGIQRAQDI